MNLYIGGKTVQEAVKTALPYIPILDYAKEKNKTKQEVYDYVAKLQNDIKVPKKKCAFALKYSSFKPYEPFKSIKFVVQEILKNNHTIFLDAEDFSQKHQEDLVFKYIINHFQNKNIYKTYQMYRKDSMRSLFNDIENFNNAPHGIKLVRGAYYEYDKKNCFLLKQDTDENFNHAIDNIIEKMLSDKNDKLSLCVASHNNHSIEKTVQHIEIHPELANKISFALLLGFNNTMSKKLLSQNYTVYKYTPYGSFYETLPYLTRRLYENLDIIKHAYN